MRRILRVMLLVSDDLMVLSSAMRDCVEDDE